MNTSPIIERSPAQYTRAKRQDGTATMLNVTYDGATGHMITGDGTLQHPLTVRDVRPMRELRAEFEEILKGQADWDLRRQKESDYAAYEDNETQMAWQGFKMARDRY